MSKNPLLKNCLALNVLLFILNISYFFFKFKSSKENRKIEMFLNFSSPLSHS